MRQTAVQSAAWIQAIGLATFVLSHASIAAPIPHPSDLPAEAQCKIYTALAALRRRCDAIAHVLSKCCRRCHRRCHHVWMPPTAYIALNTMGLAAILMIDWKRDADFVPSSLKITR